MKDLGICVEKECDQPRFLDYYVCAAHFAVYAAPRYTESMLVKVDQIEQVDSAASATCPDFRMYPEEFCTGGWPDPSPPHPTQTEATNRAPTF
jgi:hypothetical protein